MRYSPGIFARLAMVLVVALIIGACNQSSSKAGNATATAGAASTGTTIPITVTPAPPSGMIGAAPASCPTLGATVQDVAPSEFGPAVGSDPVWVSGFTGPQAVLHLGASAVTATHGWTGKLQWNVHLPFPGPVSLQGGSQSSSTPLWFSVGTQDLTTEPALQAAQAGSGSDAQWDKFPVAIFIPQAGCYFITATWHDGSWRIFFAAGL